jgi:acyl carrier protein
MADSFSQDAVESNLIEIFTKFRQVKVTVTPQSVITADLGVDSLAVMEIVAELEDTYDLTFPDEELPNVKTVGDVVRMIANGLEQDGRLSK